MGVQRVLFRVSSHLVSAQIGHMDSMLILQRLATWMAVPSAVYELTFHVVEFTSPNGPKDIADRQYNYNTV